MLEDKVTIKVEFWYPNSKLEKIVSAFEEEFTTLQPTLNFLNGLGLNVIVPKNFLKINTVYVDTRYFNQR